jgi:sugar lactone lactonase YvrE
MDDTPVRWRAVPVSADAYLLGEGPVWDAPRDRVLWVDIMAGAVHEGVLDGDRLHHTGSWTVDRTVGAVVPGRHGELLVAGTESLWIVEPDGSVAAGPSILPADSGRRLNDGACDPTGTFLVGSLAFNLRDDGQVLVRVEPDRSITTLDDDLILSNGLAWSPDGKSLYSIDTVHRTVYVRDYPALGPRRVWQQFQRRLRSGIIGQGDEAPDGLCVDVDGNLWVAFFDGGAVRRYAPTGELTGIVEVAAPHVTCPAFVGDRLLITTATAGMTPSQLEEYPDAGRLFVADVGVAGLPTPAWSGF